MKRLINAARAIKLLSAPELAGWLRQKVAEEKQLTLIRQDYPGAIVSSGVLVRGYSKERLTFGRGARVEQYTVIALGDDKNGYGTLNVGARSWIGELNNFRLAGGSSITIGEDCLISQQCSIVAINHASGRDQNINQQGCDTTRVGVVIEDDVWLGAGVVVLPGVAINEGAIVGANSTVICDIPPYEIWVGCPARKIGIRQ